MFGAFGAALVSTSLNFVSRAAAENGLKETLGLKKQLVPVQNTRVLGKTDMVHNDLLPDIKVDPETYEVRLNGEALTSEPPLAQRYFLF